MADQMDISEEEWQELKRQAQIRYEEALRQYWRAHHQPLAAGGPAYRRRCLARRRRRCST